eukprot:Nk52_evm39s355 gene=Nk52_evmTU39s355
MASEEKVIRNILLFDERRLNSTAKLYMKWASTVTNNGAGMVVEEDSSAEEQLEKLFLYLDQLDHSVEKSVTAYNMNVLEIKNYEELNGSIGEQIKATEESIVASKRELEQEKKIRQNKMEYDALATVIGEHRSREATMKEIDSMNQELENIKQEKLEIQANLDLRRKQFHLLMHTLFELQSALQEPTTPAMGNSSKSDEARSGSKRKRKADDGEEEERREGGGGKKEKIGGRRGGEEEEQTMVR